MAIQQLKSDISVPCTIIECLEEVGLLVKLSGQKQGFIHLSEMNRPVSQFQKGQSITAWVMDDNLHARRVALTLIDPRNTLTIEQLRPMQRFSGTVVGIGNAGAFVDIGAEQTGLVHISRLSKAQVDKVTDVVKVGDRVTVWIERADVHKQQIRLSMVPPPSVDWRTLQPGQVLSGTIVQIVDFGAFVDIDAEKQGLVHKSQMDAHSFITDPNDVVQIGQLVTVRVLDVDLTQGRIALSMK